MNLISIFSVSFIIALSGALMPGPLLTQVISESTRSGFKSGPLMILGHAILEALMVGLLIFGLSNILNNTAILTFISITGSLILLYFGISMLISAPRISIDIKPSERKSGNLVLLGIAFSLANPYWTIWWISIGLGFVLAASKVGLLAVLFFFLGHILADLGWYSAVSFIISRGRRFFSVRVYRAVILLCGILLVLFAFYFATYFLRAAF